MASVLSTVGDNIDMLFQSLLKTLASAGYNFASTVLGLLQFKEKGSEIQKQADQKLQDVATNAVGFYAEGMLPKAALDLAVHDGYGYGLAFLSVDQHKQLEKLFIEDASQKRLPPVTEQDFQ